MRFYQFFQSTGPVCPGLYPERKPNLNQVILIIVIISVWRFNVINFDHSVGPHTEEEFEMYCRNTNTCDAHLNLKWSLCLVNWLAIAINLAAILTFVFPHSISHFFHFLEVKTVFEFVSPSTRQQWGDLTFVFPRSISHFLNLEVKTVFGFVLQIKF